MLSQDEQWLLEEKYGGEKSAPVFNESIEEIKNKYPWGDGFFADCERLAAGEPLGYVIGWVPFLDCKIWLDNHPLIPRPETEFWVERAITSLQQTFHLNERFAVVVSESEQPEQVGPVQNLNRSDLFRGERQMKVLDLCAGSGCVGVAVAKAVPEARVDFSEIDQRLLPTIEKNLQENLPQYSNRLEYYRILASDLFSNISQKYDYILSNPPYIDPVLDRTEASVKNFEPHQALYGGKGGLELIEQIIAAAPTHLTPGGQLWLEHEPEQVGALASLARRHHLSLVTHPDQYNLPRFSVFTME